MILRSVFWQMRRSEEQSVFTKQFSFVLTGMLNFLGPEMHPLQLLESY